LKIDAQIFPAATDSRFIRNKNIPAFGFSPMVFTPTLLHDHNEFLNEQVFLKGIEIFVSMITDLATTPKMD
jgi:aminoacylase